MIIQSFLSPPGEAGGNSHRGTALRGDVLLQGQSALGLDDVQSLVGLFVHHFEEGVLEDGVQLVSTHLELIWIGNIILCMFWMSYSDLKKVLPWISSSRITPKQKTVDLRVGEFPASSSGARYSASLRSWRLVMCGPNLTTNLSRFLMLKLLRKMLLGE